MGRILMDTEGESTMIQKEPIDETMLAALQRRGLSAAGVEDTNLYHLVGRDTTNPGHPHRNSFCLTFERLSPYLVSEVLELNEAQEQRYLKAYDITKRILQDLKVSHQTNEDMTRFLDFDDMEQGYPRLR